MTDPRPLDPAGLERLLEITGGDIGFVDELVDTYLEDSVQQIAALGAAAEAGDIEAMVRPAHTLKSSSDNVGAAALTEYCRVLEADARAGSVDDPAGRAAGTAALFEAARAALLAERASR